MEQSRLDAFDLVMATLTEHEKKISEIMDRLEILLGCLSYKLKTGEIEVKK